MDKLTYKDSGVDKDKGYEEIKLIKQMVNSTHGREVLTGLGDFAGIFAPNLENIKNPVLVSGTDGVGTKLKLAIKLDKHDTVGIDCVAMSINDILTKGARPLFFLDYIATDTLDPIKMKEIIKGFVKGCKIGEAALVGGETAEMPGMYKKDHYDLAGFAVGLVDKDELITGDDLKVGDIAIGIRSNGPHSNGYSLIRAAIKKGGISLEDKFDQNISLGEKLLSPSRIYTQEIKNLNQNLKIKALAHITGGGLYENVSRVIKNNQKIDLDLRKIPLDPIFKMIKIWGNIDIEEMYHTFNMGIGMVAFLSKDDVNDALAILGNDGYILGEVAKGSGEVKVSFSKDLL